MRRQGKGSIINTASFVAVMGAATSQISYTASKGGVLAMTRELGVQFAREGIRVNALCPGPVNTPLLQELFAKDPERAAAPAGAHPDGPVRRARRDRRRGRLPGQRRRVVHHRVGVPGRRRHLAARTSRRCSRSDRTPPSSGGVPYLTYLTRYSGPAGALLSVFPGVWVGVGRVGCSATARWDVSRLNAAGRCLLCAEASRSPGPANREPADPAGIPGFHSRGGRRIVVIDNVPGRGHDVLRPGIR